MSTARSRLSGVTSVCLVGLPWKTSWTPPWRSRPSLVSLVKMTASDAAIRPTTVSRTKMLRRRSDMRAGDSLLRRGEHEQEPAVLIVGGEHVRDRLGGQIALRVY